MNAAFQAGAVEAMIKSAWFGTYYHGTSPTAEKAILREGLLTSKGGTGAVAALKKLPTPETRAMAERFRKETLGKVTMSRSKSLAKIYGLAMNPEARERAAKAMMGAGGQGLAHKLKSVPGMVRGAAKKFVEHQPLEIKNVSGLKRDPSHLLLGVQSAKDIPAAAISKARQSRLGKMLLKAIK